MKLDSYEEIITSLTDIRNCFSHRNGFVSKNDGKTTKNNKQSFQWKTVHSFAKGTETGNISSIKNTEYHSEPRDICIKIKLHSKLLDIGEQLAFSSAETYEIGFSLNLVKYKYIEEVKKYIKRVNKWRR